MHKTGKALVGELKSKSKFDCSVVNCRS